MLIKTNGKNFDKYVFDGKVDKIEIPQDFLKEIRENNLIEAKRQSLEQQLARVSADGNTDVAQKIELKLDKAKFAMVSFTIIPLFLTIPRYRHVSTWKHDSPLKK